MPTRYRQSLAALLRLDCGGWCWFHAAAPMPPMKFELFLSSTVCLRHTDTNTLWTKP